FKHDVEFWFDDGNIVLVARDVGFRIYRGLLASQSPVFADMFASSSLTNIELQDGCPTIHLSDSPEDLRDFLRVLAPTSKRVFYDHSSKYDFEVVAAVPRMAHKYNVQDVESQALLALQEWYTNSFDQWDSGRPRLAVSVQDDLNQHIGAVTLAKLTDTVSMLPIVLCYCCALGGALFDRWTRRDGIVERLDQETLRQCFEGRD
ncbi:hypothetical protein C8Q80DRAFT_1107964, partial [Daedaleopsis nitida]